jgi:hypothetical protein
MSPLPAMANTIELGDGIPNSATPPLPPQYPPIVNLVASGSQSARIEWVVYTLVNTYGESLPSPEVQISVPANYVVSVYPQFSHSHTDFPNYPTGWNCYISTSGSLTETKQNTSLLVIPNLVGGVQSGVTIGGNVFQEPATGLIAGSALPTTPTNVPNLVSGITNLVDTPPATGGLTNSGAPAGTLNTNTGRTTIATQTALGPMTFDGPQQGTVATSAPTVYTGFTSTSGVNAFYKWQ